MPLAFLRRLAFQKPGDNCAELDHISGSPVKVIQLRVSAENNQMRTGAAAGPGQPDRVLWALIP